MKHYVYGTQEFNTALGSLFAAQGPVIAFAHFDKLATSSRWSLLQTLRDAESYFDRFVCDSFRLENTRQSLRNGDTSAYHSLQAAINCVTFYLTSTMDFLKHHRPLCQINAGDDKAQQTLASVAQQELPLLIECQTLHGDSQFMLVEDDDNLPAWKLGDSILRAFALDQSYSYNGVVLAKRRLLPSDDLEMHRLSQALPWE